MSETSVIQSDIEYVDAPSAIMALTSLLSTLEGTQKPPYQSGVTNAENRALRRSLHLSVLRSLNGLVKTLDIENSEILQLMAGECGGMVTEPLQEQATAGAN